MQEIKNLPVQLLDQCYNATEAQMILEDQTGSSKFFRDPNQMVLPRLHLAIEHNNRGFVGHPMCQQVFSKTFHQGMPWNGKPLWFQILHIVSQFLLAPFLVLMSLLIKIGKDLSDKNNPSFFGIRKWNENDPSLMRRYFNKIIDFAFKKQLKLDVPINRFMIFTGY